MANTITQTSLASALTPTGTVLNVVSGTNFSSPTAGYMQQIYVINPDSIRGELMNVTAVNSTSITVSRLGGSNRQNFIGPTGNGGIGATVLIAPPVSQGLLFNGLINNGFQEFDPLGSTMVPQISNGANPLWVNVDSGNQWLYSSVTGLWVPGFMNYKSLAGVTAAVASAAGAITPSGRLFHVTGTSAITGFTLPVGFTGGSFTVIPDALWTWTAAGNIALAGSAVVNKSLTFTYDSNLGTFTPSYIS